MAEKSLGVVFPAANGPAPATDNQLNPAATVWANGYRVQHWPGNTGRIAVGDSTLDFATGTGVFGYIPPPGDASWPMYQSQQMPTRQQFPFDMSAVFVDTENANDGVLITYLEP